MFFKGFFFSTWLVAWQTFKFCIYSFSQCFNSKGLTVEDTVVEALIQGPNNGSVAVWGFELSKSLAQSLDFWAPTVIRVCFYRWPRCMVSWLNSMKGYIDHLWLKTTWSARWDRSLSTFGARWVHPNTRHTHLHTWMRYLLSHLVNHHVPFLYLYNTGVLCSHHCLPP